jgi:hypothetical protein
MRRLNLKRINHARDRHQKAMKELRERRAREHRIRLQERKEAVERQALVDLQSFMDQAFDTPKKPSVFERLWTRLTTRSNAEHIKGGLCK